jgi:hypothetical protein
VFDTDGLEPWKYCSDLDDCKTDMAAYALKRYTDDFNDRVVIGMAKDGHQIIGPYQSKD